MPKYLKLALVVSVVIVALFFLTPAHQLLSLAKESIVQNQTPDINDIREQYPLVVSTQPESTDPKERTVREKRNKKFNQKTLAIHPDIIQTAEGFHWPENFPAIPTALSDLVVIGRIADAKAYLSEDKNAVYSEYTIHIDEILKGDISTQNSLVAERKGGRVRYPQGQVSWMFVVGQGAPRLGGKYILFLKTSDEPQLFNILTAYELQGNRIQPLDYSPGVVGFDRYSGRDAKAFINEVRNQIALKR
jgi:hypothetical protein